MTERLQYKSLSRNFESENSFWTVDIPIVRNLLPSNCARWAQKTQPKVLLFTWADWFLSTHTLDLAHWRRITSIVDSSGGDILTSYKMMMSGIFTLGLREKYERLLPWCSQTRQLNKCNQDTKCSRLRRKSKSSH